MTVPLEDSQAARALKPNMYAWDAEQIDTQTWLRACGGANDSSGEASVNGSASGIRDDASETRAGGRGAAGETTAAGPSGTRPIKEQQSSTPRGHGAASGAPPSPVLPEAGCDASLLGIGTDKVPVRVLPIARLGAAANAALDASYDAYESVRDCLKG